MNLTYCGKQNPRITQQREEQLLKSPCHSTVQLNVINRFFINFTQEAIPSHSSSCLAIQRRVVLHHPSFNHLDSKKNKGSNGPSHLSSPITLPPNPLLKRQNYTKLETKRHKGPSPHHLSFQNFALLPFLTKKEILLLGKSQAFRTAFHNPTP